MKAAVYTRFGPPEVVSIEDLPDPRPGESDVLIRVCATTVTTADWRLRSRTMPAPIFTLIAPLALGVFAPRRRVLGTDCAGIVEAVGKNVSTFQVGDRVLAMTNFGSHAERVCVREDSAIVRLPANLSFEDAVSLPFGGTVALRYLQNLAGLKPKQRVLIIGASGAIGVAAVQIAVHLGGVVTGVCSTANVELVRSLGASAVVDRTKEDFTQVVGLQDIVFDAVGVTSYARCKRIIAPDARYLAAVMGLTEFWQMLWTRLAGKRVQGTVVLGNKAELEHLVSLVEQGHLKAVIDRRYRFHDIVEAHRRVDSGRKVGSVVVVMNDT